MLAIQDFQAATIAAMIHLQDSVTCQVTTEIRQHFHRTIRGEERLERLLQPKSLRTEPRQCWRRSGSRDGQ